MLKINPEKTDRQIAASVKASPTTVGKVRAELEENGDVSNVDTRTDTKGRKQPAKKKRRTVEDFRRDIEVKAVEAEGEPIDDREREEFEVEEPDKILSNFLDTLSRHAAILKAYKKVFKVSACEHRPISHRMNQEQKDEARAAIGRLVKQWQSLQRALAPCTVNAGDDPGPMPEFLRRTPAGTAQ